MSKQNTVTDPIQLLVNTHALKKAEAQYRLARLFTPFNFEPEQIDFDRVAAFIGNINAAFPQPTENMANALARVDSDLSSAAAILDAFEAQGVTPTLTEEHLFVSARANVGRPMANIA